MTIIRLQPEHMALCEEHARVVMKNRSERSRAVSWRNGEKDSLEVQTNGRASEWAVAQHFGLDPRKVLNWDPTHGDETDLRAVGKSIDVKGSLNPRAVLLIYSREITQFYVEKNFDTLLFVRACEWPLAFELMGWISKGDYFDVHYEAPDGPYGSKLDPGTWYVHKNQLQPMELLQGENA